MKNSRSDRGSGRRVDFIAVGVAAFVVWLAGCTDFHAVRTAVTVGDGGADSANAQGNGANSANAQGNGAGGCGPNTHLCGAVCADNTSPDSCGSSCEPCPKAAGGTKACNAGKCAGICPAGQQLCFGTCTSNTAPCTGSCPAGTHNCDGLCADDHSVNLCGPSCTPCTATNGITLTCNGQTCERTCPSPMKACGLSCIPSSGCCDDKDCVAMMGQSGKCDPVMHACSYSCAVGSKPCGTACIPSTGCCMDADCAGHFRCVANTCSTTDCADQFKTCGTTCVPNGPGACCTDSDCPGNFSCTNNVCSTTACATGYKPCNGKCIATAGCCADQDCGMCKKCTANSCQNESASEDVKNECADDVCKSGSCNGQGRCGVSPRGQMDARCGGRCNQCDGNGACGNSVTCYQDKDTDSYGQDGSAQSYCFSCPARTTGRAGDCDDNNPNAHPGAGPQDYPRGDGSFDWNCSGQPEHDGVVQGCDGNCQPIKQFDLPCGSSQYTGTCGGGAANCMFTPAGDTKVKCK